jgi:hypothetical protein
VRDLPPRSTEPENQDREALIEALIEEITRIVDTNTSISKGNDHIFPPGKRHIIININIGQVTQQISQIQKSGRDDMPEG